MMDRHANKYYETMHKTEIQKKNKYFLDFYLRHRNAYISLFIEEVIQNEFNF